MLRLASLAGRLAMLASLGSAATARADNPRDLFGLGAGTPAAGTGDASCAPPNRFGCALDTDPLSTESPYGLTTWLSADYLERLPVANNTFDAVASWGLGATRDEAGVSIGGATGLENRWTVEGAPVDSLRTGAAEMRVPIAFISGVTVTAAGFRARDRVSTGGTIDATLVRGGRSHTVDARVYTGLSATSPARPIPALTYQLRRLRVDPGPEVTLSLVATGPIGALAGGTAWYAAGLAPTLYTGEFQWSASRLTDRDDDGIIDGLPSPSLESIGTSARADRDVSVPFLARVGWDGSAHHLDATLVGHAGEATRYLANATLPAAGIDRGELVASGTLTWRGQWKNTRAFAQVGWHRSERSDSAKDAAAANTPQFLSAYVPTTLADDPGVAQLCNDGAYPQIPQCPILTGYFASGGAGLLTDAVGDRPSATAEIAHRASNHTLRAGGTLEDARLVLTSRYTGGSLVRSLFEGHEDVARFYTTTCGEEPGTDCTYASSSSLRYRTRYTAAYVQDTWMPEKNIVVDGGLRWETMWVGSQLHHSAQFAPRGGVAWDFLGEGRSRLWVSGGRSFAYLPAGLGNTISERNRIVHDIVTGLGGGGRSIEDGSVYLVEDGTQPMTQDELSAGLEVGLPDIARATLWAQGRYLRRGLETSPTGFGNPGANDNGIAPAERQTQLVGAEIALSPTAKTTIRVGYFRGRVVGNFAGPYDPQLGAQLYDGLQLDAGFQSTADAGRLPTDPGQRFYLEADRRGRVGPVELHAGTRLTVASGRPRGAYADTDVGFISLIPRGTGGRGPLVTQANVRLGARWRRIDVSLDVFNVFRRSTAVGFDDFYSDGTVRPIEGGSVEDLVFLKTTAETPATKSTRYGLPYSFQAPLSAFLSVRALY